MGVSLISNLRYGDLWFGVCCSLVSTLWVVVSVGLVVGC